VFEHFGTRYLLPRLECPELVLQERELEIRAIGLLLHERIQGSDMRAGLCRR
jgi:hypothetical protein